MTGIQKFFKTILPKSWADDMETESRAWHIQCSNCKHETTVWDNGGIRWKAAGNPRRLQRCANCGQTHWHTIYKK